MNNKIRELRYVKLDQSILKLMIFIDVFFVNNKDLSSQIEYVICLTDDTHVRCGMVRGPNRTDRVGSECGFGFGLGFETLEPNRSGLVWFGFCRFGLSQLVSQKADY